MIHRFWIGPPRRGADYRPAIEDLHPGEEIIDWTPYTLPEDLQPLTTSWPDPRRVSNLVRYALLYRFGGLYLDHDVEPLQNLTFSPTPWTAALLHWREGSLMWFPEPGHLMMAEALHYPLGPHTMGSEVLHRVGKDHPEVGLERRVLPRDRRGISLHIDDPLAIHHWEATR